MSTPQGETPQIEFVERLAELEQAQARLQEELAALRAVHSIPTEQGAVLSQEVPQEESEALTKGTGYFSSDFLGALGITVQCFNGAMGLKCICDSSQGVTAVSDETGHHMEGTEAIFGQSFGRYGAMVNALLAQTPNLAPVSIVNAKTASVCKGSAQITTFDYLETFSNRAWRYSTLQCMRPLAYEELMC